MFLVRALVSLWVAATACRHGSHFHCPSARPRGWHTTAPEGRVQLTPYITPRSAPSRASHPGRPRLDLWRVLSRSLGRHRAIAKIGLGNCETMQRVLVALCLAGQCTALVPNGVTACSNGKAPLKVLNCVQNRILRARRRGGSAAAAAQRHAVASLVENDVKQKYAFRPSGTPPRPDTTHPPRNNTKTQAATRARQPTAPIFSDVCSETGVTLSRFMIETALANPS